MKKAGKVGMTTVFIGYSHFDKKWLDKLLTHLKPLTRSRIIRVFADTDIGPGSQWKEEIRKALASANVALLLVSSNFLASEFIAHSELPPLLDAAEKRGLRILWVSVSASLYDLCEIAKYQAANDPSRPLDSLKPASVNKELVAVARKVQQVANSVTR